jgi:hypothetical protein
LRVETFDKLRANATQEHAGQELCFQFLFGNETHIDWERSQQERAVEIAGVIDRHHVGPVARQVFESLHDERRAGEPQ